MADKNLAKTEILLESGTNELEIIEFCIEDEFYGINVTKVSEIIRASIGLVPVPDGHESISGVINLRGRIIPVVNLAKHLKVGDDYDEKKSRIIVAEFNKILVGFWVSFVTRIHRISWRQVEPPADLVQSKNSYAVGVIKIEDRILFLLDFEKISSDINPKAGGAGVKNKTEKIVTENVANDRTHKKILIAEDSPFVRQVLVDCIGEAGYQLTSVENGAQAWETLKEVAQSENFNDILEYYHLLVTDIEMPQMDGLHLIKKIKNMPTLRKLPCLVYSSMITKELAVKCNEVGADGQIAKPDIERLIQLIDEKVT